MESLVVVLRCAVSWRVVPCRGAKCRVVLRGDAVTRGVARLEILGRSSGRLHIGRNRWH